MMSCSKCCGSDKSAKEDIQIDSDISGEKDEILLQSSTRNGRIPHDERNHSPNNEKEDYGKRKIRELVCYYINHCTLHGFHYVFETKSIMRKVVWLTILAVAAGFFFKEIKTSLTQYYLYPFTTTSTIQYPGALPFPAVTICDFHDVRKSLHSTNKTKIADVISISFEQLKETLIQSSQSHGFTKPTAFFDTSDFYVFYSSKGQTCYTFNSARNKKNSLKSNKIGSKYGIEFILNVQQPSYSKVKESGFRFILHEHDELPLSREGFRVSPGYVTYVNLRLEKVSVYVTLGIQFDLKNTNECLCNDYDIHVRMLSQEKSTENVYRNTSVPHAHQNNHLFLE
ncbi:acid-sensing ion channel 1-like [Exaiptasia diaphana]|uniref:Uncharacterized protein n=1 Tax=Exaiptasia diaphana TaxID=2652724 RepID=A0A913XSD8_EXADI|nr:acid-sensing ion channel 1-like [Exaiptasia diaphana]